MASEKRQFERGGAVKNPSLDDVREAEMQLTDAIARARAEHVGEIVPVETLIDRLRTVPGVNS